MNRDQKLKEVTDLLGRTKLSRNENWMFDNYFDNTEYEFRKDDHGKLCVHKIKV